MTIVRRKIPTNPLQSPDRYRDQMANHFAPGDKVSRIKGGEVGVVHLILPMPDGLDLVAVSWPSLPYYLEPMNATDLTLEFD